MWRVVPGVQKPILSREYRKWLVDAGWDARIQLINKKTIEGKFDARIEIPAKSRRDNDSYTKGIFDLCQKVGAVRNDRGLSGYSVVPTERENCLIELWDLGVAR